MTILPSHRGAHLRATTPAYAILAIWAFAPAPLRAEETTLPDVPDVVVSEDKPSSTGSRLGLSARETPATIDSIDARTIEQKGIDQVLDAVRTFPGVTAGGSPGEIFNVAMRGFSGNLVQLLRDGWAVGPVDMIGRPQNIFNLRGIEVLKGPATVLYGQGSVGGAINVMTKQPEFGPTTINTELGYGSFNTQSYGIGIGGEINPKVAGRFDVSYQSSDGWIKNNTSDSLNATASILSHASDTVDVKLSIDVLHDNLPASYGTPLLPASVGTSPVSGVLKSTKGLVIDSRTLTTNYEVSDAKAFATQLLPMIELAWRPSDAWTVRNKAYYFWAERRWLDSEQYDGVTNPGSITRDRFQVSHVQNMVGDIADATNNNRLFGLDNKTTVGAEYSYLDFVRRRGFPDGDKVSVFDPAAGYFGASDFRRRSPTRIKTAAGFGEDVLSLTDALKLVTGLRYEMIDLDRRNFNADTTFDPSSSFSRTYYATTYRGGLVYDVTRDVTLFGQYTASQEPPGSNVFLVNASENIPLSESSQIEGGIKTGFDNGNGSATVAGYYIKRKDFLMSDANWNTVVVPLQESHGLEASVNYKLTENWVVDANLAYTVATFGQWISGSNDFSGHHAPNSPTWMTNLWTRYSNLANLPIDIGTSAQYVGKRAGDYANSLILSDYILLGAFAAYHLTDNAELMFKADNLLDKTYVQWADVNYPSSVMLGAPRSFSGTLRMTF